MTIARLSVVLATPDSYERLRKTVSLLASQTVSSVLEIVLASPKELADGQDVNWARFAAVKLVETGPFRTTGHPKAVAVMHCTAPVVAFAEDHCFPEPDWAENLISLHNEQWAAGCPALGNANPGAVSWADTVLNFGPSLHPVSAGSAQSTPWHNTSYKRELLRMYGERLEHMVEAELRLQEDLTSRGYKLFLAGGTHANHVNISRWSSFLLGQLFGGRLWGSARAEACGWSGTRRLLSAFLLPLIPLVRAPQIFHHSKRTMSEGRNVAFLLACVLGLIASALGEATGYAFGPGSAGSRRIGYEFQRERHVRSSDRKLLHLT